MSLWTAAQQPRLVRTDNISHLPPLGLLTVERSQGPTMRSSWMQSTLLANPAARQQGYRWLSDRVLHTSQRHPHPFGDAVADRVSVVAHRGEDTDGATVAAIEGHYQFTAFGDFRHVSQRLWVAKFAPTAVTVVQVRTYVHAGRPAVRRARVLPLYKPGHKPAGDCAAVH
ncbi:hypothetical protein AaE_014429 [Aphanomyces astaci]|uniref:Uncharacterized protein n=1 Tax=Aphanomyces astaci TaxID=112090 RepID=A0A6A4Z048_APHAT|nr:hypothetical protein AaE_014429 [Aphanomyces astaci]